MSDSPAVSLPPTIPRPAAPLPGRERRSRDAEEQGGKAKSDDTPDEPRGRDPGHLIDEVV